MHKLNKTNQDDQNFKEIQIQPQFKEEDEQTINLDQTMYELLKNSFALFKQAIPQIYFMFFVSFFYISNIMVLKWTQNHQNIAGYGIGITFQNIIGKAYLLCVLSGSLILTSHAYGARQFQKVGQIFNQALFTCISISIFTSIMCFNAEKILIGLGVEHSIAAQAQYFSILSIPTFYLVSLFDAFRYFLYAQKIYNIQATASKIAFTSNIIWLFLFVVILNLELLGVAISRVISFSVILFLLIYYMKQYPDIQKCRAKFQFSKIFLNYQQFLQITLPAGIAQIIPWIYTEITTILAGQFSNKLLATSHIQVIYVLSIFGNIGTGIQITMNSLIGIEAGAGNKRKIQYYFKVSTFLTIIVGIFMNIAMYFLENIFIQMVCTSQENIEEFIPIYRIGAYGYINLLIMEQVSSILISPLEKQNFVLITYVLVDYVFGIPFLLFLTKYLKLELIGLWIGITTLSLIMCFCFYFIRKNIDLDSTLQIIKLRNKKKSFDTNQEDIDQSFNVEMQIKSFDNFSKIQEHNQILQQYNKDNNSLYKTNCNKN